MRHRRLYPERIRVDQGSELISRDLDLWAYQHDVTLDFSRPASRRKMRSSRASTAHDQPANAPESPYTDRVSLSEGGRMREIPRFVMESICHNQPDSPFS